MSGFSPGHYRYVRTAAAVRDGVSRNAAQHWDIVEESGKVVAHAEVFEGREQWGVRLFDQAPALEVDELVRLVAHLLVWHAQCRTETVDLVLGRTHEHQTLVRVSGDYV